MKRWLIPSYFVIFSLFFTYNSSALTLPFCPHDQSAALIQFNSSFSIDCSGFRQPSISRAKTISWEEGTNCCLWDGVKCDTETGNVIALDLSFSCLFGPFPSNNTLFLLRHLRQLNLAGNDFRFSPMASQFGQLTSLTHLNISWSSFIGKVPPEISRLSKLLSLDLSMSGLMFEGHVFENMVANLTQLRHLLLSEVNMSQVVPTSFLNMSSYIQTLVLENNYELHGKFPEDVFRFPYLQKFRVSSNFLELKFPKTNWSAPLKSLQVTLSYLEELPDSIGDLTSLEILDLPVNHLGGPIPASLGNLTQLKYLDLSDNNLSGVLPVSAFNLRQVQFVDFSGNKLAGSFPSQVSELSQLSILDLDRNFLSGRVPSWLFSLPSLVLLRLSNNKLTGPIDQFDKVTPLEEAYLQNNEIEGPVPGSIALLVNLIYLDLSSNKLSGNFDLDKLSKLKKLESLTLSNNALLSFTSESKANYSLPNLLSLNLSSCDIIDFPDFVRNLEGLRELDLSNNRIHVIEANMFVKLKELQRLDLSHNSLLSLSNSGNLSLFLPNLGYLSLSSCNLTAFANFLTIQESLRELYLSNNSIQGQITKQERTWGSNLVILDLSNNLLTVVEYYPWRNIKVLRLDSNLLEGPLLVPPPSISVFSISNNKLTGEVPYSICEFGTEIDAALDLSHNNLSGVIPKCAGLANIAYLDLHANNFHGNIPDFCVNENNMLSTLNLNDNDFDGPLPKSLANCLLLEVLILGNNKINDTFPYSLGNLPSLQVLVLRSNNFHGQVTNPDNQSYFSNLRILDLSHNNFSGYLPTNFFKSLEGMMGLADVDMAYMGDRFQYYTDSMVLTMKGEDIVLERILTIFAAIDMSSNKFEGTIPETVGNLISLQVLNFSHNHLTGHIPSSLGNLVALESLDLSCNELVGEIPSELTGLNFLEVLNLSENQLVGLIPQGKQFNTFLNDSYAGNIGLCGFPVSKSCGRSEPPPAIFDEEEVDSAFGLDWKFVMMGYGCGLVFGFSAGYIMMTIRKPKWLVVMIQRAGNRVLRRFKKYR
ncbi:receptor-like protein 19 [Gossypium raimondii]|nr:receptor-like protein 19 [Gossypium raimondii]